MFFGRSFSISSKNTVAQIPLAQIPPAQVHDVAWGFLRNRTTESFEQFFRFLFASHPDIHVFVSDRHYSQSLAITRVFGENVHVLSCCVHLARNIASNTGSSLKLTSLFWKMRYQRTAEAEAEFVSFLERVDRTRKTTFTTHSSTRSIRFSRQWLIRF